MFADLARLIVTELKVDPEWQLDVADEAGKPVFRLRIFAETL